MLQPVIRNFILCEKVVTGPDTPRRVSLHGLLRSIRSTDSPSYPLLYREINAYIQMTGCRGSADLHVDIYHADSGNHVFQTDKQRREFEKNPLQVHGLAFRILNLRFVDPGLYWFEFCYNGIVEAICPLVLR